MLRAMSMSPELRAGDGDRDRTIGVLREAFTEGRLTQDEFEQRMASAPQARTCGDLAALTPDLPALPPAAPSTPSGAVAERDTPKADLRKAWGAWVGVSVLVNVIWAASWVTKGGSPPYYWPIWVMGPWGAAMALSWLTHRGPRG